MHVRRRQWGALGALMLVTTIGTTAAADPPELLGANRARAVAVPSDAAPHAPAETAADREDDAPQPDSGDQDNAAGVEAETNATSDEANSAADDAARLEALRAASRADEARPLGRVIDEPEAVAADAGEENASALPSWLDDNVAEVARVVGALAVVIGLILVARMVLTRVAGPLAGGSRPSGVLEILARYPMGKQQSVVLMRLGRRVLVVHHAGQAMTTLTDVSDPDEVADLLSRMESGSRLKDAARFRKSLEKCQSEHQIAEGSMPTDWPASRNGEAVVIDLTRPQRKRSA